MLEIYFGLGNIALHFQISWKNTSGLGHVFGLLRQKRRGMKGQGTDRSKNAVTKYRNVYVFQFGSE